MTRLIRTLAAAAIAAPTAANAQPVRLGLSTVGFFGAGRGLDAGCVAASTVGFGVDVDVPLGSGLSVTGGVHQHSRRGIGDCPLAAAPEPSPLNGTHVFEINNPLFRRRFVTTELAARYSFPLGAVQPAVGIGIGNAWRAERDVPFGYGTLGARVGLVGPLGVRAEWRHYRMHTRFRLEERTFRDGVVVSRVTISRNSPWQASSAIGVAVEIALQPVAW